MDSTDKSNHKSSLSSPAQRNRRKIARQVAAMFDDIARGAGFEPSERRTAFAISTRLYERDDQPHDTPRGVSLAMIGAALTSRSDDKEARETTARRHVGQLFNHAIPRTGWQILTRYRSTEEAHHYVDNLMPVAAFFSELLAEEVGRILSDKGIKAKGERVAEARARLVAEAVTYLPKCEVELVSPEGVSYAYVSAPEAKSYCAKNPEFKVRAYEYIPPAAEESPKKPFYDQDLKRIEDRIKATIEDQLDEIATRNSYDEARLFSTRLNTSVQKLLSSWAKVAGAQTQIEEEHEELSCVSDLSGGTPQNPAEIGEEPAGVPPDKLSPPPPDNLAEDKDLQTPVFEASENQPDESENFDDPATAADFYIRDGWAVVPCCQFESETGLCTGPDWHQDEKPCKGKRPLIKGRKDAKPGDGYTAASRDRGLARDWFTRQFPDAGIAIRLDRHILIDCDVKDGAPGLESYQILADTFDLPETLSAITPSGGRHHIFKLPEDLLVDFLGSWTRVADKADLGGLDLKVDVRGLAHVEPTRGAKGLYRWVNPTFPPATLPRECCDYMHKIHAKEEQAQASASSEAQPFDPAEDQAKYFKDMPNGKRRPRLRSIAACLAHGGANEEQIVTVLKYHDGHFTEPTNDTKFIARAARRAVLKFGRAVAR